MKITEKDVLYVAALANLELSEQETAQLVADLDSILAYVEKLNELDTSRVEPMAQVLYEAADIEGNREQETGNREPLAQVLRADQVRPSFPQVQSLANAPESAAGQFKVPKVIER